MALLRIDQALAKSMELDEWGAIESAESPMQTRGNELWRSDDEKVGTGV